MRTHTAPARGEAEQEKTFHGFSKSFFHLFDEQWFFYNVLSGIRIIPNHGGLNDGEPAAEAAEILEKTGSPLALQLIRTPSIQPPRSGDGRSTTIKEEPVLSVGRKLLYSCNTLDAPRQSILSPSKSMGRKRPPRTEMRHQWFANARLAMAWEANYSKDFQIKKWRSLGDLETMELQGFRDLGFVFDGVEGLGSRLTGVAPSPGECKEKEEDGRIYLPETWFTQRSAPVMVLQQVHCRSGEEMKKQLRFWARAVACNVWGRC